jgi:hypothetical protein
LVYSQGYVKIESKIIFCILRNLSYSTMSQYGYNYAEINHIKNHDNVPVHENTQTTVIKIDYVYSEIISRKIIAEYFKKLFERLDACIKWTTKLVYYAGSGYILLSLVTPNNLLIPIVRTPISRFKVLNLMSIASWTTFVTIGGLLGRGFVSCVMIPFARYSYSKYEREATEYINSHS